MPEDKQAMIEPGDQLVLLNPNERERLQLRKPTGRNSFLVKAEHNWRVDVWTAGEFLSKLSGLKFESFRLPGWLTATAGVFFDPSQEHPTEEQKVVAS